MKICWSERARSQIREIFDYIARDRPEAVEHLLEGFLARVDLLAELPEQGTLWADDRRSDVRPIIYESHRIVCRVTEEDIAILSVRHTRLRSEGSEE